MNAALICIDVDGTLLDSTGDIPQDALEAIDRLRHRGVRFALCSGRPAFGVTLEYANRLDPQGWHIFQNGASVVRPVSGETDSVAIDRAIVEALIERSRRLDRPLELYTDHDCAVEKDCDRTRRHAALLGIPFRARPFATLRDPILRAQWLVAHERLPAVMEEAHEGLNVCPSHAPLMPDTAFVNMTAAGVDKGRALKAVAAAYGIPLAAVMMIGDGNNDVGALEMAGLSVAMGNASAACLAAARFKVAHVDEGGLLEALELVKV